MASQFQLQPRSQENEPVPYTQKTVIVYPYRRRADLVCKWYRRRMKAKDRTDPLSVDSYLLRDIAGTTIEVDLITTL